MASLHLVTQAYGRDDIRQQALYAASSALAWGGDASLEVHVYTDDGAAFAPLAGAVDLRILSAEEIRAWRGPHDFVHRLKPLMIRDLAGRIDGKLLYVDADVIFGAPPAAVFERIGPGRSVLHVREYDIATHDTAQLRRFRRRMGRVRFRGAPVALDHAMWNAGVVGLDASHFHLLDEWAAMVDEIYPQWPYWIHEQYAISQLLQRDGSVSAAEDAILHYWNRKEVALPLIRAELDAVRGLALADALAHVRANPLVLPPFVHRHSTLPECLARIFRLHRR